MSLKEQGQYDDARRRCVSQAGADAGVVRRHVVQENALLLHGALPDDPLAERDAVGLARPLSVSGQQLERALFVFQVGNLVDCPLLSLHKWHQIGEERLSDCEKVALPLEHAGEPGDVGLEPVLLFIALGGLTQVGDHRVDVVLELGHLPLGVNLDRACQITLRHRGRDLGDGTHLSGEIAGQQVHVIGKIAPRSSRAGDARLTSEPPLHTDLSRDADHLLCECRQRVGHVVDGLGKCGNLALGLHRQLLSKVTIRDGCHDLHDSAHLIGKVGGHEVHIVGQVFPCTAHA